MKNNGGWYAIEEDFWCPCQDKISSSFFTNNEHLPDCVELKHKILFKVSDNIEFNPQVTPQREDGKGRNSVVEEFLANLETLNNTRRRSSSKLLPGFTLNEEMYPSVSSKTPGLEVYLPACFSPTKLEKLTHSLDKDTFEFSAKDNVATNPENLFLDSQDELRCFHDSSGGFGLAMDKLRSPEAEENGVRETTEKFLNCSLREEENNPKYSSSQRNLMERQRRNKLNERFARLRESIPDIANQKNISKVNILKTAVEYIKKLEQEEKFYTNLKVEEKARNSKLFKTLVELNSA